MDDKFYWIKLKTDFFEEDTIDWLQEQKDGCNYIVLYLRLCLLTANNGGILQRKVGEMVIPYETKKIAEKTHFSIDTVVVALELFKRIGLVIENTDGFLELPLIKGSVGVESNTRNAIKQRAYRQRLKQGSNATGNAPLPQGSNATGNELSDRDRDRDREESKEIEIKESALSADVKRQKLFASYQEKIKPISGSVEGDRLSSLLDDYGLDLCLKAIDRAVLRKRRSLRYISGILRSWQKDGYDEPKEENDDRRYVKKSESPPEEVNNIPF